MINFLCKLGLHRWVPSTYHDWCFFGINITCARCHEPHPAYITRPEDECSE